VTEILAGCALSKPPGPRYVRALVFAEIELRPPLPRLPTLRRWRYRLPAGLELALSAPQCTMVSRLGPFRFDDDLQEGLQWTVQAADALGANAVVLRTPSEFTTSRRDRDRFAAFSERLPRQPDRSWIWAPAGLWDADKAYPLAEKLGLVCAFDPLTAPVPAGEVLYARLVGLGTQRRYSEVTLNRIVEAVMLPDVRRAYVAFDSAGSFRDAVSLKRAASEASP
jgi:uncharacterized protein YecE (DUF72 family)